MSLKTDAILLQYTFHQFQYIMTTCLCAVETNQQSFSQIGLMEKKMAVCFTIISNLTVTTRVSVNNVRADIFPRGIFITKQRNQFTW